jgi:UV DNA damage endonuclease
MNENRLGYACINMTLANPPKRSGIQKVYTGRSVTAATYKSKGLAHVSNLALQNACDLLTILEWNERHNIRLFRIGSELFPRHDHYELKQLPLYDAIREVLAEAGKFARNHGHRLTTHPGPFHVLGSVDPEVVRRTIIGLERHSELFDLMGFEPSYENKINIHVGSAQLGHDRTSKKWIDGWHKLSDACRARVVLENDDKASLYSVRDLYRLFYQEIGIPITFDYWHHTFCTGDISEEDALKLASSTWPSNIRQAVHYSESRRVEHQSIIIELCKQYNLSMNELQTSKHSQLSETWREFSKIRVQAHADYVHAPINTYGLNLDIMLEAKAKELALLRYRNLHL